MAAVTLTNQKDRVTSKMVESPGPGRLRLDVDANKDNALYLPFVIKAFRVDVGGTVKFTVRDESVAAPYFVDITRTFAAGEKWDMCPVYRVWTTGTTATGIDGVY